MRTICRSVWFVKCTNGGGANVTPGGGTAGGVAGAAGAGHALGMNGAGAGGPGSGGACGRPTSAVDHEPTQRSCDIWAFEAGAKMPAANIRRAARPAAGSRISFFVFRFASNIEGISLFGGAGILEHLLSREFYL